MRNFSGNATITPTGRQFRLYNGKQRNKKCVSRPRKLERMKRANKDAVADRFNKLDFHDDALKALKLRPPRSRNDFARIDFELQDDSTDSIGVLSFHGCANFRFVADFDVLADNWPFNTESSIAKIDVSRMRKFVKAQWAHWRTTYMPPMTRDKPIRKKLAALPSYILFRVAFFGGTAEILAKHYSLKRGAHGNS